MKANCAQQLIKSYEAHLRSREVSATEPSFEEARCAAVFVLFTVQDDAPAVMLMRRPRDRGKHRGEWAFPGGVREQEDGPLLQTAFRETEEEFGVPESAITFWGGLEPVKTVGTRFEVWPFTGWVDPGTRIIPSPDEVDEIAAFPIATFTSLSRRRNIHLRRNGTIRDITAYVHEGKVVWGATARILSQIFDSPNNIAGVSPGEAQEVRKVVGQ